MTDQPDIYPMPSFPTLAAKDVAASAAWYQQALGFTHVFTMQGPGGAPALVHLRWAKYADLLLRGEADAADDRPKGLGISLSFSVFEGRVDDIADRARSHGARLLRGPGNRPWNARDFSVADPDGFVLTFTQGPVDPGLGMDRIIERGRG
jgi:uncharacterized glyoxalase superfamily protein PhnB